MLKSMTGYGKGVGTAGELTVSAEIKSVNHRYADINVKGPRTLLEFEGELKKRVGERLKRGKIDLFITLDSGGTTAVEPSVNRPLAQAYVDLFKEMTREYGLEGGVPLELLVSQRDVVTLKEGELPREDLVGCLEAALTAALDAMEAMRLAEGRALQVDIEGRLALMARLLGDAEQRSPLVVEEWRTKLTERLARLEPDLAQEPQRVAQEIAIFADRCDISEEITRFRSHLEQFTSLLGESEPVGRKMDFLVQELNREVNTIGSKANDAVLSNIVVTIKAEIEKVREQIQNIE